MKALWQDFCFYHRIKSFAFLESFQAIKMFSQRIHSATNYAFIVYYRKPCFTSSIHVMALCYVLT